MVLGFPLLLHIDCIYSTPQTALYATQSDYVSTMKQNLQGTHQLMQEFVNVNEKARRNIMIAVGMDGAMKLEKSC